MKTFGRLITAMVTPFYENGEVHYARAAELAKHLVASGSDGVVVAGSTGEAATLEMEEKLRLFAVVAEAVGDRASVIAGTGSNDTRSSIRLTKEAAKTGINGVMLVGPYYNKPPQEGYYQHFKAIAAETDLPVIIYNVPGRTASNILPDTIARLAELPNVVAVKEASGNLEQVAEIIRRTPPEFMVYSGDDSLTLPILALGGVGTISVCAHVVGRQMREMVELFQKGDLLRAQALNAELSPFYQAMFCTTNPIPIKTAVSLQGLEMGGFRLPLVPPTADETARIRQALENISCALPFPVTP